MSRPKPSSRENGRLSQGPITQAGKDRAKLNALRHGLLAQHAVVLATESTEDYDHLLDAHHRRFRPEDEIEAELVSDMAAARWRMRRLRSIETGLIDKAIQQLPARQPSEFAASDAFTGLAEERALSLLLRYEAHLQCSYQRAFRTLQQMHEKMPAEQTLDTVPEPAVATPPPAEAPAARPAHAAAHSVPVPWTAEPTLHQDIAPDPRTKGHQWTKAA